MSLYQRLGGHARFDPRKPAIESEAGTLSYYQLLQLVDQCSCWFNERGIKKGDRVAMLALNHPDWFIVLFAAARSGIILVPLNWRLSAEELTYIVADCSPALLLHDAEFEQTATALAQNGLKLQSCCHNDFPPPASAIVGDQSDIDNELLIVYTSGTTGRPKGAALSQKAILCSAEMSRHMYDLTSNDRVLNVLPLFHVGGLNIQPLPALLYGATLVSHQRFDPVQAVTSLNADFITLMNSVPTILQAMFATDEWRDAVLKHLRSISIGSTDVPRSLIKKVREKGVPLIQVYGATEMAPVAIYQRVEHAAIEGSIGREGFLNEIRLVNGQGGVVAPGESGEIQVKGDNLLCYYWNNKTATDESISDGWFGSGDVAHQDEDGFYWFDDRLKYTIISGGENIYPAELERLIREVPGVEEVSVVGRPDERWGEVPVAVVVKSTNLQSQKVLDACSGIARYKQCKDVLFVDALPRNALGKVIVSDVRKLLDD